MVDEVAVEAWRVRDTGLVAVPGPFRRLAGGLRHHRDRGEGWPEHPVLSLAAGGTALVVAEVGRWPLGEVRARRQSDGPPVTFVLDTPAGQVLLAAPAGAATDRLLDALSGAG